MFVLCFTLSFALYGSRTEGITPELGVCQLGGNISLLTVKTWMNASDCSCHDEGPDCERSLGSYNESSPIPLHRLCNSADLISNDCLRLNLIDTHLAYIRLNKSTTTINCHVCGRPPLDVTWYREGRNLPHGAHCSPNSNSLSLLLRQPSVDDCGVYVCVVRRGANEVYVDRNCIWHEDRRVCQTDGIVSGESCCRGGTQPSSDDHSQSIQNNSINVALVAGATAAALLVVVILLIAAAARLFPKKWGHPFFSFPWHSYKPLPFDPSAATGTVYISYADDSDSHRKRIRDVVNTLTSDYGLQCCYFEYDKDDAREQFVFAWVENEFKRASAYVVVWSQEFEQIIDGTKDIDPELYLYTESENFNRTRAEWRNIQSYLHNRGVNRCIPVLIDGVEVGSLPPNLSSMDPLHWPDDEKEIVNRLYSLLTRDGNSNNKHEADEEASV